MNKPKPDLWTTIEASIVIGAYVAVLIYLALASAQP